MEVIVFEKEAYYKMLSEIKKDVREVVKEAKLEALKLTKKEDVEWVDKDGAMDILKCRSGKLQQLRDELKIKFSQEKNSKNILYLKSSLYEYLESNIVTH